jgi:hypothetical protein
MDWCLDGRLCPMLPLDGLTNEGTPTRAVYFYKSTEGAGKVEVRMTNSLLLCPDDNGDSWGASSGHKGGAVIWLRVPDGTNEQEVLNRLLACHANRERAWREMQALNQGIPADQVQTHGEPSTEPHVLNPALPLWQRLGFASKAEWKAAGSPQS